MKYRDKTDKREQGRTARLCACLRCDTPIVRGINCAACIEEMNMLLAKRAIDEWQDARPDWAFKMVASKREEERKW